MVVEDSHRKATILEPGLKIHYDDLSIIQENCANPIDKSPWLGQKSVCCPYEQGPRH